MEYPLNKRCKNQIPDHDMSSGGPMLWLMQGPSLGIFMVALALSGSLVSRGRQWMGPPGGSQRNWTWSWRRLGECPSSACRAAQAFLPLSLLYFLPSLHTCRFSPVPSGVASALPFTPPFPPCALFFPYSCQFFIPPLVLCHTGGSCLLTSLAAFLGLLSGRPSVFTGMAG